MRVGTAEHRILYVRVAQGETVRRAPSEARAAARTLPEQRATSHAAPRPARHFGTSQESTTRFERPRAVKNRCGQNPSRPAS